MYTCITSFLRKLKLALPFTPGCGFYFPQRKASEIPRGRGSKRRKFPRGGVRFSRSFFQDFETRIIIDDLTLTLLAAECFLTAYKILVYM